MIGNVKDLAQYDQTLNSGITDEVYMKRWKF